MVMEKWFVFGLDADLDVALKCQAQGNHAEAASHFEVCLEKGAPLKVRTIARRHLIDSLLAMARDSQAEGRPLEAVSLIQRAVTVQPEFADLRLRLALAYREVGDLDAATGEVEEALKLNSKFRRARLLQVWLAHQSEGFDQAKELWREAATDLELLDGPTDEDDWVAHIEALISQQDGTAALLAQAEHSRQAGKPEQALALLEEAATLQPGYADVRCNFGRALMEMDRLDEALSEFKTALGINPRYADAHALSGVVLRKLGDREGAEAAFRTALEIHPTHPVATAELDRVQ